MSEEILSNVRQNLLLIQPYQPGKPIGEVKKEYGLEEVIKLASNENPLGPSKKAQQAIIEALGDLHRYPDGGAVDLKEALAAHTGVSTKQVLVGNGSDDCIKLISETFVNPGDEVVMPTPSFSQYWFGTQLMAGTSVPVELTSAFEYDFDRMLAAITDRTKIVYLCTPNNPTGTYIKRDAMQAFIDRVPSRVLVVIDEAYNEYVTADDAANGIDFLQAGYNVLVMRTFSKMYSLAALRIGYVLGKPDVIEAINRSREPFNVNHLAQRAAIAALTDTEHVEASRAMNRAGFDQLTAGLEKLGYQTVPTQSNFLIFDTGLDDKDVFQHLLQAGVITRSGSVLGIPGFLRVSIGNVEENKKFLAAFERVVSQIKQKV